MDTQTRSMVKTISWRAIATAVTFAVSYLWLQDLTSSVALAIVANAAKALVYYGHERVWNAWSWAREAGTETRLRSVAKSASWRAIAIVITLAASFLWLHEINEAASFVGVAMAIKAMLYYIHERLWNVVRWGRVPLLQERPTMSDEPTGADLAANVAVAAGD